MKQKSVKVPDGEAHARESARQRAISLAQREWTLWYTQDNGPCRGYASYSKNRHTEHVELHSTAGRLALSRLIYNATGQAPSRRDLEDTLAALEAIAIFDSPRFDVHVRVADLGSKVYLDLANDDWQVAEVTSSGWTIIPSDQAPIKFRRPNGTLPLPTPLPDGDLLEISKFINTDQSGLILAICWLLNTLTDRGPHPILAIGGRHGSAKSTATSVLQRMVDPRVAERRSPPRTERDLAVAATNCWITGFDNVSKLSPDLADGLCRLATGSAFTTRSLYSDGDEVIFAARRPIILNSIVDLTERPDLNDRTISIQLNPIDDVQRISETEFWPSFEAARPKILGALLTALATALSRWSTIKPVRLPRMADFYWLIMAAGPSLPWDGQEFEATWSDMQAYAINNGIESSALLSVLLPLLESVGIWKASATELLSRINAHQTLARLPDDWPQTPQGLVGALRRLAPMLEHAGWILKLGGRATNSGRGRSLEISPKPTLDHVETRPVSIIELKPPSLEALPQLIPTCNPIAQERNGTERNTTERNGTE